MQFGFSRSSKGILVGNFEKKRIMHYKIFENHLHEMLVVYFYVRVCMVGDAHFP